mgnify:FL=1
MGKRLFLIGGLVGIVKNSKFFVTGPGKQRLKIVFTK